MGRNLKIFLLWLVAKAAQFDQKILLGSELARNFAVVRVVARSYSPLSGDYRLN
jgi:hypothetical protein